MILLLRDQVSEGQVEFNCTSGSSKSLEYEALEYIIIIVTSTITIKLLVIQKPTL